MSRPVHRSSKSSTRRPNSRPAPKTRFRYRLEGFDADWVDAGMRREALYTNLPPRDYVFRVSVSQDDGRWSETEATFAFTLHPRFYQTWWFYLLVAASLGALTWGAWQVRVRQLRRQFALVLGERVRLSRELHDTLLQSLVGVALEFDAVSKSLESSPATARQRVIKIREQVEEVHPRGPSFHLEPPLAGTRHRGLHRRAQGQCRPRACRA